MTQKNNDRDAQDSIIHLLDAVGMESHLHISWIVVLAPLLAHTFKEE